MNPLFRALIGLIYFGFLMLVWHFSNFEYAVISGISTIIMNSFELKKDK